MRSDGCSIGIRAPFAASCKPSSAIATGARMTCDALEITERKPFLSSDLILRFASGALGLVRSCYPRLDIEALPDHMKRDMGFMDGRSPLQDDEMFR
ncbi:hypothetical protein [Sinorhizobium mexicanum]|nr:hypothetical protein [Sinorhizobium mexicanum]